MNVHKATELTGYPYGAPISAGDCAGCGGEMYDYEVVQCPDCGKEVHRGCIKKCFECGHVGCTACLIKDETDEFICGEDCKNDGEK